MILPKWPLFTLMVGSLKLNAIRQSFLQIILVTDVSVRPGDS